MYASADVCAWVRRAHKFTGILRKYTNVSIIPERRQIPSVLHRGTLFTQTIHERHGKFYSFGSLSNLGTLIKIQKIHAYFIFCAWPEIETDWFF